MKPYLIQRGRRESRDWKQGIDSLLVFEYMGSAEYEFGALPESLGRIRDNIKKYIYFDFVIGCEAITCLYKAEHENKIKDYLTQLSQGKIQLKERSKFDERVYPIGEYVIDTDFWWDIENDIMFWIKDTEFEKALIKTLQTKPEVNKDLRQSPVVINSFKDLVDQVIIEQKEEKKSWIHKLFK